MKEDLKSRILAGSFNFTMGVLAGMYDGQYDNKFSYVSASILMGTQLFNMIAGTAHGHKEVSEKYDIDTKLSQERLEEIVNDKEIS